MKISNRLLLWSSCAALALFMALPPSASAGEFRRKHPRRAEVNRRERNQEKRIRDGVEDGKLTKEQASQLRADEKAIKTQERAEVKANGGSLTKGQQKDLNQELNAESKKIYDEKH